MAENQGRAVSRRSVLVASTVAAMTRAGSAEASTVAHVVLLGDSVFDNAAYVGGGPDVRQQLAAVLPQGSQVTLLARDGAVIADVAGQLAQLPAGATHVVVSAGGNDALGEAGVLDERARSVAEALNKLAQIADRFTRNYTGLLGALGRQRLPTAVCTIYEPRFPEPDRRRVAAAALTQLNDRISREAFARRLSLVDLRVICNEDADFANPIEPSVRGGDKIARAIASFATGAQRAAAVFT